MKHLLGRLCPCALACLLAAAPASAQFQPRPVSDPAIGEGYHIEGSAGIWFPSADISVTSAGTGNLAGIEGTPINAQRDLGMPDRKRLPELQLVLKPTRRHKFRLQYIPITLQGSKTLALDIKFNGQLYHIGLPVDSTLDWKAYRFGYEYDFLARDNWFAGFILEAKYTNARVDLVSPGIISEFAHAQAPLPAIGGIGRYYVVPNVSITGEVTGFKLPTIDNKYGGHYVDVDVYGTYNVNRYVGVEGGFRSLDLGYLVKEDTGSFVLRGLYLAAVVRY